MNKKPTVGEVYVYSKEVVIRMYQVAKISFFTFGFGYLLFPIVSTALPKDMPITQVVEASSCGSESLVGFIDEQTQQIKKRPSFDKYIDKEAESLAVQALEVTIADYKIAKGFTE